MLTFSRTSRRFVHVLKGSADGVQIIKCRVLGVRDDSLYVQPCAISPYYQDSGAFYVRGGVCF